MSGFRAGLDVGDFDVDIDAVQEWTGDAFLVAADHGVGTGALIYLDTSEGLISSRFAVIMVADEKGPAMWDRPGQ